MQASGFLVKEELYKFPGVHGVVAPLRPISNSVVKRYSGENSWRVASCKDSSMPGLYLMKDLISKLEMRSFTVLFLCRQSPSFIKESWGFADYLFLLNRAFKSSIVVCFWG
jgi:hypothetical protein